MAENTSRFVIINGVQVSKERAKREGLLDDAGRLVKSERVVADAGQTDASAPAVEHETRARGSQSAKAK